MAGNIRKVMVQFHFDGEAPDLPAVAARFGIEEADIDKDFGVIVTDEKDRLATVLASEDVAQIILQQLGETRAESEGTFSNPQIAPFGPPEAQAPDSPKDKN